MAPVRHELGEPLLVLYVSRENSDTTEGRGHMKDCRFFIDVKNAHDDAKGRAVMGQGDGNVNKRTYYQCQTCDEVILIDDVIYVGDTYMKKNVLGNGTYANYMPDGWRKDFSPMVNDPEYKEYLRLKKRFEQND